MNSKKIGLLSLAAIFLLSLQSFGAIEVLMKLEGMDVPKDFRTKSQLKGFDDGWSKIFAVSNGFSVDTGSSVSRVAARPQYQDFTVVKLVDEITPSVILTAASGKHISKVTIAWVVVNGEGVSGKSMEFILEDVLVSSSLISGSEGDESGSESMTLNWGKLTINAFSQDARGSFGTSPATSVTIDAATGNVSK